MSGATNKITALYCRLSQEDARLGESLSIENQKAILLEYAKKNHFPNPVFFVDDGYSGTNYDRPGFQSMLAEIEAFVNAANEQELEAAWNNLSAEEQRVFEQLMEEEPPEDALAFFAQLYDDAPKEQTSETVNISENEIYFKRKPLTEEQKKHSSYVDENGNLHVKNLSAFWIPELTTTEKVGHTTYTVTGSYEGKESFLKKLERIVAKNAQQKFEDEGADE